MDCLEKDGLDHPFLCPGMDGIAQRARKAMRLCPGMDGIAQRARKAMCLCPGMDGIPQRARKAVRMFTNLVKEKNQLKMLCYCHTGFVYA